ncbi:CGNR zinc finger domain-containing protein [Jeotgalibacillus sp. ET6]|uniref:CGNR zinc finger domain-containing protein n=1 Tax=Jeotgalibacillus sp. ET6 TaxID=3037260 RepID=UPI002418B475|nr:CGNR zinc finger domain-containing protein [Jeotgalibacillus sp. ET6]MDG5472094.1 CGNR zinc finger domain-containing protein [Jeotgalibacillus sp. ET6]
MDQSILTLGGTSWINLVNTTYISNKQKIDILADASGALQWLKENHLLRESDLAALEKKEVLDSLLVELESIRTLCSTILSEIEQGEEHSLHTTNKLKKIAESLQVSLAIHSESEKLKMTVEGATVEDHVMYHIIDSIMTTFENTSPGRIRKCNHEECKLYFVDTSKGGKRRWCSMELCGNRKKAAEFYSKKKKK